MQIFMINLQIANFYIILHTCISRQS